LKGVGTGDNDGSATEAQRLRRELEAVRRISAALSTKTRSEDVVRGALQVSLDVVGAGAGSIILYDEAKSKLVFRYVVGEKSAGLTGMEMESDQGIAGEVFSTGEAKVSHDMAKEEKHRRDVGQGIGYLTYNMVTVPLKTTEGTCIGVMQVLNKHQGEFDAEDVGVLEILAGQAAIAIESARLQEEARLAVVTKMIGDISHDVKNMVTPLVSTAATLKDWYPKFLEDFGRLVELAKRADPREAEECQERTVVFVGFVPEGMDMVEEGAARVQARVREIADCVKGIVSPPQLQPGDVRQVVEEVARDLQVVAQQAGVSLETDLADVPETLIDERRLYSAVYNLVNNAIPEAPRGGKVSVRLGAREQGEFPEGRHILIEVRDTGRGMTEEVRRSLFTDRAISTKRGGTGLGTRIIKQAVEGHGGQITVDSELGKGSVFRVRLPIVSTLQQASGGEQ
jgi:signal transduction histidine kinase